MKFTTKERQQLRQLILDCSAFRLSDAESISFIERHIGKPITRQYLWMVKKDLKSDAEAGEWMNHFVQVGYITQHKALMDQMERVSKDVMRVLFDEISLPYQRQNKMLILATAQTITKLNKRRAELELGIPVINAMRDLIENGSMRLPNSE